MAALKKGDRVFVAGHRGLVGSAVARRLESLGGCEILVRSRQDLNLLDTDSVYRFLRESRPDAVVLCAAKVGGIFANTNYPADFIFENLAIQNNVIWGSHLAGVPTLLFMASNAIYPREAPQPLREQSLMTGPLEPTNAPYAVAKIAGVEMCKSISRQFGKNYFAAILSNIYGPNDNFDARSSHVVPALIRKFHEALPDRPVEVWGTGNAKREFLHADDVASACRVLLGQDRVEGPINVGCGATVSIRELAEAVRRAAGHRGDVRFDASMPEGFLEKRLDVSRMDALGWKPAISLEEGLVDAYRWYALNVGEVRETVL